MGSLEDTRAQIMRELRYQSSLDLQVCHSTACLRSCPPHPELSVQPEAESEAWTHQAMT